MAKANTSAFKHMARAEITIRTTSDSVGNETKF